MSEPEQPPHRPDRVSNAPLPEIPDLDLKDEISATKFSRYRTGLSRHRTDLSEHRTDLSEYRTDLSTNRTDLSMRRSGMSIHRTRMSADRTLMSVIRTALSLIGFGFTIHEVFKKAVDAGAIESAQSPRNFGLTLLGLGVLLLVGGIFRHAQFALQLRSQRQSMIESGLIHGESDYPISMTLITAVLLLIVGILAVVTVVFNVGFLH